MAPPATGTWCSVTVATSSTGPSPAVRERIDSRASSGVESSMSLRFSLAIASRRLCACGSSGMTISSDDRVRASKRYDSSGRPAPGPYHTRRLGLPAPPEAVPLRVIPTYGSALLRVVRLSTDARRGGAVVGVGVRSSYVTRLPESQPLVGCAQASGVPLRRSAPPPPPPPAPVIQAASEDGRASAPGAAAAAVLLGW